MKNKNKKTLKRLGTVALVSCLVLSGSAWLTSRQTADGINKIKTGSIKIDFVDLGTNIALTENDAIPMSGAYALLNLTPYNFSIQNTGTIPFVYQLKAVLNGDNTFDQTDKVKISFGGVVSVGPNQDELMTQIYSSGEEIDSNNYTTLAEAQTRLAEIETANPGKKGYYIAQSGETYHVNRGFTEEIIESGFSSVNDAVARATEIAAERGDANDNIKYIASSRDGVTYNVVKIDYSKVHTAYDGGYWYSLTDLINGWGEMLLEASQKESYKIWVKFDESLVNDEIEGKKVSFHLEAEAIQADVADFYKETATGEIVDQSLYAYYWFNNPGSCEPYDGPVYQLIYDMGVSYGSVPTYSKYKLSNGYEAIAFDNTSYQVGQEMPDWDGATVTEILGTGLTEGVETVRS